MNRPTKYYISGAISSLPQTQAKAQFAEAEERLRKRGAEVVNPTKNTLPDGATWEEHMTIDIIMLLSCQAVYMLPTWEQSKGASLEHRIAKELGMAIEYEQPPHHPGIKEAINRVMGVSVRELSADNRNRWQVYARAIYAHHAKAAGDSIGKIAGDLRHDHSTISYYLRKYEDEICFNREFRAAAANVEALLKLPTYQPL